MGCNDRQPRRPLDSPKGVPPFMWKKYRGSALPCWHRSSLRIRWPRGRYCDHCLNGELIPLAADKGKRIGTTSGLFGSRRMDRLQPDGTAPRDRYPLRSKDTSLPRAVMEAAMVCS